MIYYKPDPLGPKQQRAIDSFRAYARSIGANVDYMPDDVLFERWWRAHKALRSERWHALRRSIEQAGVELREAGIRARDSIELFAESVKEAFGEQ